MSEPFNAEKFERLHGMELGRYAIDLAEGGHLPPNCVEYVRSNAARWNGQHLEMVTYFLWKTNTTEAWHLISIFASHPLKHIRYTILGLLEHHCPPDPFILSKLAERLSAETDDFEEWWIRETHRKVLERIQTAE